MSINRDWIHGASERRERVGRPRAILAMCLLLALLLFAGTALAEQSSEYPVLVLDTETDVIIREGGEVSWFSFTPALGSDWDAIAGSRYGAAEVKDSESDYVMAEGDYGTELAIAKGQIAFCALAGDYTITVDLDALTCVIEKAGEGNKFDVNGDNKVDVGDVNAILEAILAGNNEAKFDVNGDTTVDVGDVNAVLEAILAQ